MKLAEKAKHYLQIFPRIFLLTDIKQYMTKTSMFRMLLSFLIGGGSSGAKIIAPAAFGRAIEMIAKNESEMKIVGSTLTPLELLILAAVLTAWLQGEQYIQTGLLTAVKNLVTTKLSKNLSQFTHQIVMKDHIEKSQEINNSFLLIQNSCSQLPMAVSSIIYPTFFDLGLGLGLVASHYGKTIMAGFLIYSSVDLFIINSLLNLALQNNARFQKLNEATNDFYQHEHENVMYEETIRISNRENFEVNNTEKNLQMLETAEKNFTNSSNIAVLVKILPHLISQILTILYIYKKDLELDQLDELVFLITYFNLFVASLNRFSGAMKLCLSSLDSFDKITALMSKKSQLSPETLELKTMKYDSFMYQEINLDILSYPITIEFNRVNFSYSENNTILKNVSFTASPCNMVAIVGPSGVGKSTIAKLLYGLYYPDSGYIMLNGIDTREIPLSLLRTLVSFMPQVTDIFRNESLKYNVLYGVEDENLIRVLRTNRVTKTTINIKKADERQTLLNPIAQDRLLGEENTLLSKADKMYRSVMREVNLTHLVSREDSGEKIKVSLLSGGEKQRLGLARALVRNSKIFLADEPTSSLDSFHEHRLLEIMRTKTRNQTSIMMTHRLATIKNAEKILVLDKGEILESGTHEQLLKNEGIYHSYWRAQC